MDYTVNAATGFPLVTGPTDHVGPVNHVMPAWDVSCGLYAVLAVLAALRRRDATGEGSSIRLPLDDVALATAAAYFGLEGDNGPSIEEIGEKYDLTKERIRQIKERAIKRLQKARYSNALKVYLG